MLPQPFLTFIEGKIAFLKLYLMPYGQFEKLICYITGCLPFLLPEKIEKSIFTPPYFIDQSFPLAAHYPAHHPLYNSILKVSSLEHLDIFCLTYSPPS
jgi:hypothetical protein